MSYTTRLIRQTLLTGAAYAVGGAVYGSIGAKILQTAGYDEYSVLDTIEIAATGNAALGTIIGLVKGYIDREITFENILPEVCSSIYTAIIGGGIGYAILSKLSEMQFAEILLAIGLGSHTSLLLLLCIGHIPSTIDLTDHLINLKAKLSTNQTLFALPSNVTGSTEITNLVNTQPERIQNRV